MYVQQTNSWEVKPCEHIHGFKIIAEAVTIEVKKCLEKTGRPIIFMRIIGKNIKKRMWDDL